MEIRKTWKTYIKVFICTLFHFKTLVSTLFIYYWTFMASGSWKRPLSWRKIAKRTNTCYPYDFWTWLLPLSRLNFETIFIALVTLESCTMTSPWQRVKQDLVIFETFDLIWRGFEYFFTKARSYGCLISDTKILTRIALDVRGKRLKVAILAAFDIFQAVYFCKSH